MTKSDYTVEVIIKDNTGEFKNIIDKFKGSPESVAGLIMNKYCTRKKLLPRIYEVFEITESEFKKILGR